jgi:hypothetical protein
VRIRHAIVGLLVASQASASPDQLAFAWEAPAGCPARDDVEARIARRAGELDHLVVTVTRSGGGFVARLELDGMGDRELRTLSAASCGELVDAVSVIVARIAQAREGLVMPAVAIVPVKVAPVVVAARDDEEPPDLPPRPRLSDIEAPVEEPPSPWHVGVRVSAVTGAGVLPSASVADEVGAYLVHGPASLEIAYSQWETSHGTLTAHNLDGIDVDFTAVSAHLGFQLGEEPVQLRLGGETGSMLGRGVGAAQNSDGPLRYTALGGGMALDWSARPGVRIVGIGEVDVAAQRPIFELQSGAVAYEPQQVSVRISLGLELGLR